MKLTADQIETYNREGYLLASGLVPTEVAVRADALLLGHMDTPELNRLGHFSHDDPRLVACYTSDVIAAAASLAGDDPSSFPVPTQVYVIPTFPTQDEWKGP